MRLWKIQQIVLKWFICVFQKTEDQFKCYNYLNCCLRDFAILNFCLLLMLKDCFTAHCCDSFLGLKCSILNCHIYLIHIFTEILNIEVYANKQYNKFYNEIFNTHNIFFIILKAKKKRKTIICIIRWKEQNYLSL